MVKARVSDNISKIPAEDAVEREEENPKSDVFNCLKDDQLPFWDVSQLSATVIISLISVCCFAVSLPGEFVFDDSEAIVNNKDVRQETPISSLFSHDFWGSNLTSKTSHKSYRPLAVLTFRLNYWAAGGYRPLGFHMINIMLHALNSLLVLKIYSVMFGGLLVSSTGKRIFTAPKASFMGAILFAVHPIHTENVAGIVGRADLLCAFCVFSSFLSYIRCFSAGYRRTASRLPENVSWPNVIVCVLSALLAMLCKEQGITVLGICAVYDFVMVYSVKKTTIQQAILKRNVNKIENPWILAFCKRLISLCLSAMLMLLLRLKIMGSGPPKFQQGDNPAAFVDSSVFRVANFSYIYSLNIWLLLNPWWLCFDWAMGCIPTIENINDIRLIIPVIFWIGLIIIIWKSLSSLDSAFGRILTMSLAFIIIPFLPASNLFFTVGFVIAERVLYLSSVGFISMIVLGIVTLSQSPVLRKACQIGYVALTAIFIVRCIQRSAEWLNEDLLFKSGENVCPLNAKVHYNIGKIISEKGDAKSAIKYYREAIRLKPDYDQPMNNLGNILKNQGHLIEAETILEKAVNISPKFAAAWMNLGTVKADLKKHEEAKECYLNAIKHRSVYPDAHFNLGNLYLGLNNNEMAINQFKTAILQKPNHPSAWLNLILLLDNLGRFKEAAKSGQEAAKHLPDDPTLFYNLGSLYGKRNFYKEAEKYFLHAIRLNPRESTYHGNLVFDSRIVRRTVCESMPSRVQKLLQWVVAVENQHAIRAVCKGTPTRT